MRGALRDDTKNGCVGAEAWPCKRLLSRTNRNVTLISWKSHLASNQYENKEQYDIFFPGSPHFPSGIVGSAWKSLHAGKGETRRRWVSPPRLAFLAWVDFTSARVSLALLSLRKMGTTRSLSNLSSQYVSARANCWRTNRRPREKNPRSRLKRIWAGHWTEDLN